ncbi:MAG: ABC transporter ATP-binding protein [Clostridia bacterium]
MIRQGELDEFKIKKGKGHVRRLMKYFRPYIPLILLSVLLAVLINGVVLAKPYLLKHIIDDHIATGLTDMRTVQNLGILFFAITVAGTFIGYAQTYLLTFVGQRIMYNIRSQLFTHIQNMSMAYFDHNSSGRLLTRVTNDVEALNEVFSGVLINLFRDVVLIIGIIVVMFSLSPQLAGISLASIPLIALVTVFYRLAARKNFIRMKGMISKINGFLAENINGMRLVQIFNREKEKYDEFKELDDTYYKTSLREVILNSLCRPVVDVINNATIVGLLWFCTSGAGIGIFEIGLIYVFVTYIKQIFEPISEIAEKYTTLQSAMISSERIFEILDTKDTLEDMEAGRRIERLRGKIEFRNVWFAYNDENWVLKDVSFTINPGETCAFVGPTGCGKSTVINLMARFYEIQKGVILIDDVDIMEYNLRDLRRQISVVLQDVFMFSGDIRANIRLNNMEITDEMVEQAARQMHAAEFIESLPGQYDEEVKERGCTFSAGQRQLLSFARAVAFNPSVLVLDEATASIDTQTEAQIQKAMEAISKGRTSIIIAHRLSTIKKADRIIVITNGKVRESGTHRELLRQQGIYSRLYHTQFSPKAT